MKPFDRFLMAFLVAFIAVQLVLLNVRGVRVRGLDVALDHSTDSVVCYPPESSGP